MIILIAFESHPAGIDGRNHILVVPPLTFLPKEEFDLRHKSVDPMRTESLMGSIFEIQSEITVKKNKSKELNKLGTKAFQKKNYAKAEKCYSEAIELNTGCRPLWTNRAACRNTMKKYGDAISDCDTALSIDPKCTRSIIEKGNALFNLARFDEAKECYESLRSFGKGASADSFLKKIHKARCAN